METFNEKLGKIIADIELLYIDSKNVPKTPSSTEKKYQNYLKGSILIEEATRLLDKLQEEIIKLDTSEVEPSQVIRIHEYLELLSKPGLSFDNVLQIVQDLKSISKGLPVGTKVYDHIEKEIVSVIRTPK